MTLNLSIISPNGIHQSADFRLLDMDLKLEVSSSSAKLVHVRYKDWFANITYCGIGRWKGRDTFEYLSDWLTHGLGEPRSVDTVISSIQTQGSQWLEEISRKRGMPRHTFVFAGFSGGESIAALISNFERLYTGQKTSPLPSLEISRKTIRSSRLLVHGLSQAVADEDRRLLKSLADPGISVEEIQRTFARVNGSAAVSTKAGNGISESCWVYSLMPNGYGCGRYFGEVKGELAPLIIQAGINFNQLVKLNPAPGRKVQMGSVSFVTAKSLEERTPITCDAKNVSPDFPERIKNICIDDLGGLGGGSSMAKAINDEGRVVGEGYTSPSGPTHAVQWSNGEITSLGTLGGPNSVAQDINNEGCIVGSSTNKEGDNRAFVWTVDKGMWGLGTLGGRHSNATAINDLGFVVGSSWAAAGQRPPDPQETAFLWGQDSGMRNLGMLSRTFSRAYDISDECEVVGISSVSGFVRAFIWDEKQGMRDIGTLGGDSAEALAINNKGEVIGMSETKTTKYRPFIWTEEEGMRELLIDGKVNVRDISDDGYIIGDIETSIGMRSFVWNTAMGMVNLPWLERHDTQTSSLNNCGEIAGQIGLASTHFHAVRWKIETK